MRAPLCDGWGLAPILALAWLLCPATSSAGGVELLLRSGFEESACPDGATTENEQCDDGNAVDEDGCTSLCRVGVSCGAQDFPGGARFAVHPWSGHCFVGFDDEMTGFEDARTACTVAGGHLATMTDVSEQAVVSMVQNPGQNPWIGAMAPGPAGAFAWVTGEPFAYTHFAPGEPNGDGECLHLFNSNGEWNDTICTFVGFVVGRICEFAP